VNRQDAKGAKEGQTQSPFKEETARAIILPISDKFPDWFSLSAYRLVFLGVLGVLAVNRLSFL